jgi:transcriptional regulator with XRE-family HTH domain
MSDPEVIIRLAMTKPAVTEPVKGLREIRKAKGLSALELSRLMDVTETTIFRWQSGKHEPTLAQMHKLCAILGCSLDELFPREEATA